VLYPLVFNIAAMICALIWTAVIHDKILPILEDQPGFVDEILLVSDTEPDKILALSFWESQQDAERYTHEQYPRINELIFPLVESAHPF